MKARFFRINAFVDAAPDTPVDPGTALSSGNPAAVVLLTAEQDAALPDARRQALAAELNLSETAFVVLPRAPADAAAGHADTEYGLRWFTPVAEVALCGHATLAAAAALVAAGETPASGACSLTFRTLSGQLVVSGAGDCDGQTAMQLSMEFPLLQKREPVADAVRAPLLEALRLGRDGDVVHVFQSDFDYVVQLNGAAAVRAAKPDMRALREAGRAARGVIVTAPCGAAEACTADAGREGRGAIETGGDDCPGKRNADDDTDFVSRFFAPALGVPEDPVTGSAHCALAALYVSPGCTAAARQLSGRGGRVEIARTGAADRVQLSGTASVVVGGAVSF